MTLAKLQEIPDTARLALALVAATIGLLFILRTDSVVAGLRRWLLVQLKWLRRPGYRRMLRLYGWLLLVAGALLALLLVLKAD